MGKIPHSPVHPGDDSAVVASQRQEAYPRGHPDGVLLISARISFSGNVLRTRPLGSGSLTDRRRRVSR